MEKYVKDIVQDVRTAIDEIGVNDSDFLNESDDLDLDSVIKGRICEAVDWVHGCAALDLMAGDAFDAESVSVAGLNVADMIRFVQAKGANWSRAVAELTEEGSEEYALANDQYVGASADRPAVLLEYSSGSRLLKLLPSGSGTAVIVKRCEVREESTEDAEEVVETTEEETTEEVASTETQEEETEPEKYVVVDANLYAAMVEYLGGLTLMTLDDGRGENMVQLAKGMIGIEATSPK